MFFGKILGKHGKGCIQLSCFNRGHFEKVASLQHLIEFIFPLLLASIIFEYDSKGKDCIFKTQSFIYLWS